MAWSDLTDIYAVAADELADELSQPPVACPLDGTPLVEHDDRRVCPMGNYEWPRDRLVTG